MQLGTAPLWSGLWAAPRLNFALEPFPDVEGEQLETMCRRAYKRELFAAGGARRAEQTGHRASRR